MVTEIKKGVYWVGVVDWGLRHFHGHELSTHRGSSYNSYLIKDKKTVLVDTVWTPFAEEFMANLQTVVDPAKIDIIVCNHSEVDHSGALPLLMKHAPNAQIIVSKRGEQSLPGHYHAGWKLTPVGTGDSIDIGERKLTFFEAPMLHWPDSMFTHVSGSNLLMPNDAFGQHYATAFRFNDEVNGQELIDEALKYYVNIINPFADAVLKQVPQLLAMNLPIDMIAPSHGVIWRKDATQIVSKYVEWATQKPAKKTAVILYDSMWEATRRLADAIGDGLADEGMDYKSLHLATTDRNDVLVEAFKARTILFGSSTINNGLLPALLPILSDVKHLKFKNKLGGAFGSYGWSGEAVKLIEEHMAAAKMQIIGEGVKCKWQPTADDLQAARNYGRKAAQATKQAGE